MENENQHKGSGKSGMSLLRSGGLAIRYTRFFILAFLIVFSIAFYYTFSYTRAILDADALQRASNITDLTISRISNVIKPVEQVPYTLSSALEADKPDYPMITDLVKEFVLDDTVVFGSAIAFEPYMYDRKHYRYCPYVFETLHTVVERDLSSAEYDYFNKDWYRIPKLLGEAVWSEPYYDKGGGDTLMCTYSVPFYHWINHKRVFAGVITMDISLQTFRHILNSARVSKTGFSYLLSRKGRLITPVSEKYINTDIRKLLLRNGDLEHDSLIDKMLLGERMFVKVTDLQHVKVPSWIYSAPVPHTGWIFAITFPTRELYAGLYDFFRKLIAIFFISLLAMIVITILITRKFIRPISRLVEATRRIGQGDFGTALPVYRSKDEISQLTNAFSRMKDELVHYISNLQEATAAREKMEGELSVAHDIQMGLLPKNFPVREDWDLAALLDPARAVGGDLYDFYFLDDDHLFIAIGDVSGKGVPASLFMVSARTLFRSRVSLRVPLNQSVYEINKEICRENPNQMFVTFIAGIVDLKNGIMTYCNAGHNPPFLIRPGGKTEKLKEVHGIPLGIFEHATYASGTVLFSPGDAFLMYTDGVTEALNIADNFYGDEPMLEIVRRNSDLCPSELIHLLESDVIDFMKGVDQADDITLLILKSKQMPGQENKTSDVKQVRLLNRLGELNRLVATLEQVSEAWAIPPKVSMELNLILEELFTNIVFYAFDDGRDHEIILTFSRPENRMMQILLEDDGREFNLLEKDTSDSINHPIEDRQIGGLGIHFVKQLVNEIRYERKDGKNVVLLIRNY
ncbi:MAG: SpoIIE family protein phosphatase [Bacteroidetes bacterium]|nr:SpoIIE family protein phosphatase [Bacteroidota bacterium]